MHESYELPVLFEGCHLHSLVLAVLPGVIEIEQILFQAIAETIIVSDQLVTMTL